ncbi:MAG: RNase adapter RapZ [Firmicutes bacterium]|nr:RNase adapter RapZ [Bacillota bacterium]
MKFLIVTGMSGGGKSKAVDCLEDMGFYCVDNMPLSLIGQFIELTEMGGVEVEKAAFGVDIRGSKFFDDFLKSIRSLEDEKREFQILFLEASDEVLVRRYQESRRNHPMGTEGNTLDGIHKERDLLQEIRKRADFIIDTTQMKTADLKEALSDLFDQEAIQREKKLSISILSFGFKHGIPLDADNVFDMRFIPNPFYLASMRNLTGNNKKVRDYVMKWEEARMFRDHYIQLVKDLIPYYIRQGKASLVLAFGCTGGRHRSVVMANEFYQILKKEGYRVSLTHRDL